ncbi:alpha/beta hydrolase fold domain-containing protein [Rhodococcus rhodochrous]|nr:alpha/beta hydrolase fold domain-containing protein [Rhodococcus rhodochrous]
MSLSPHARKVVDASAERMGWPMHEIPVPELRASLAAGAAPGITPIHHREDLVVPSSAGGVPIRIYRPSDGEGLPLIQWMHSGGFTVGGLDQNEEYLRKLSNATGAVVVSVDYRLAPDTRRCCSRRPTAIPSGICACRIRPNVIRRTSTPLSLPI